MIVTPTNLNLWKKKTALAIDFMKPTDEEIEEPSDAPVPEISDFEDVQQVADKLPAYQEFVREQKLNEVWRLTFSSF